MQLNNYESSLQAAKNREELYDAIVNAPFASPVETVNLGLGIVVLLLQNKKTKTLDRIALSNTDMASGAVKMSAKPFHEIKIPLDAHDNILVKTIESGQPQRTDDWNYLFTPVFTPQEARFNQYGAGIEFSVTYPLYSEKKKQIIGAMIFSYFDKVAEITEEQKQFMETIVASASKHLDT